MEKKYSAHPEFTEMITQFSSFQQESMDTLMATLNTLFSDNGFTSGTFSDPRNKMNTLINVFKSMVDSVSVMLSEFSEDSDRFSTSLMESLPGPMGLLMKKLLNIPPVGITRPYQEKVNAAIDKFGGYTMAAMEFLSCTVVPIEEATRMTLSEALKQSDALKSPDGANRIYNKWIQTMEDEYQVLYKTDRYKSLLAKIFNAMGEFNYAKRELTFDLIHLAGLPFGREIDELCKDAYETNKTMKRFEKRMAAIEKQLNKDGQTFPETTNDLAVDYLSEIIHTGVQ